jgi:hypothetical protein
MSIGVLEETGVAVEKGLLRSDGLGRENRDEESSFAASVLSRCG